jgi:hypothetical protein
MSKKSIIIRNSRLIPVSTIEMLVKAQWYCTSLQNMQGYLHEPAKYVRLQNRDI